MKGITRCNLELPRLGNFFQTVLYVRPPRPCHRFVYIEVRKNKKYKSIECMRWSKASQKFPMVSWFKYFCQLASSFTFQIYGPNLLQITFSNKTWNRIITNHEPLCGPGPALCKGLTFVAVVLKGQVLCPRPNVLHQNCLVIRSHISK